MTSNQQRSLPISHSNNRLFADYYLGKIIPSLDEWNDNEQFAAARKVYQQLKVLRASIQPAELDEAQLEELWVKPILGMLGHHYAVQVKLRYREKGYRKPDYVLLRSDTDASAITSDIYEPDDITHALAVADAKRWGAKLDQSTEGQRNPSQQIDEYLRYSELPWGILTDGRVWRLYHRESSKYNTYYAVDLDSLLGADSVEAFLYFYVFFNHAAFTSGWLERVLKGSEDFAQKLTDKLEDEVYDALELLAQGFLDYRRNNLTATPETLRTIYEQSLVFLYRLLFIFYAESREILPIKENTTYKEKSLRAIKRRAAQDLDRDANLHADSDTYYRQLQFLFFAIDAGDDDLGLPPYNGKLFSDTEHPFLRDKMIGDVHLVPALDKLARMDVQKVRKTERVFVDYRDLDIRHLGSVYEKLLEFELDVATEPLRIKGKKQEYVPSDPEKAIKQPGQVLLRTGNNERKITGSYYTPDYIVRFIVEKTLEPLLTEITSCHANLDDEGKWAVHDAEGLIREVLNLNVLDPATGSGHFAVDATAYIAEWLRALGLRSADMGEEDELLYWKRQVASACIYAVDINPLAVELAKLSLWLATLAKGKPLSFLNHHIRVGNSLVGARIGDMRDDAVSVKEEEKRRKAAEKQKQRDEASGQMTMFSDADFSGSVQFAVEQMTAIESTVADDILSVKKQEGLYAELTRRLQAWRQAADVWTARHFGLELNAEQWKAVRTFTTSGQMSRAIQKIVTQAEEIAAEHHFFHWELAFPEVFFDTSGQPLEEPGFDAVIGNPPYVRQERIQPIKPFLSANYRVYSGTADLFLFFYERGLEFLRPEQRLGYITSGTYMNSNSAKPFREYIHDSAGFEWVANFGENQPFKGAEMVYPTMAVLRRGPATETFNNLFVDGVVPFVELGEAIEKGDWVDSLSHATGNNEWRFQDVDLTKLFEKVTSEKQELREYVEENLFSGIKTGFNDAFIINGTTREKLIAKHESSSEVIKPLLRGQDMRPWYQVNNDLFIIEAYQGIQIDEYPAIRDYLSTYQTQLEPKPSDHKGKWDGRAGGTYQWYEFQATPANHEKFGKPKICWADISKLPRFSWNEDSCILNTGFMITDADPSLLAILQSRVVWFAVSQFATPLRLRAGLWQYRLIIQYIERLPIPELTADQQSNLAAIAQQTTALARQRYALHEDTRQTILSEFNGDSISTRVALYQWWELEDEKALSDELKTRFKTEIPLKKRSEWRGFLAEQKSEHQRLTDAIIAQEVRLNDIVYDAFDLTPEERQLIEEATKYPYGAV